MNNDKLALIFTSGFSTQLVIIFEKVAEHDDLCAILERVYHEIIKPKKYYGLVVHEDDMEFYGIEKDDDGYYEDMIYIDENYYIACETLHNIMMSDDEIKEYQKSGIEIIIIND